MKSLMSASGHLGRIQTFLFPLFVRAPRTGCYRLKSNGTLGYVTHLFSLLFPQIPHPAVLSVDNPAYLSQDALYPPGSADPYLPSAG